MADYVAVAHLDQLSPGPDGGDRTGLAVALFNVEGTVFAMEDACRHAGAPWGAVNCAARLSLSCPRLAVRRPHGQAINEPDDRVARFLVGSWTALSWSRSTRGAAWVGGRTWCLPRPR